MGWITVVLNILGLAEAGAPILERLLSGFATFISTEFAGLFGDKAAVKIEDAIQEMEYIVGQVDQNLPAAVSYVKGAYADLEGLLAAEPWLAKFLHATSQIQASQSIDRGTANKLLEAAHSNVATAKTAA